MAVYKRSYKPYRGGLTSEALRWLVLARYALERLFDSKLVVGYMVACYIFPIFAGTMIYLRYNLGTLAMLGTNPAQLVKVDANFFAVFLSVQSAFSFLFTAYAAPGLIGPDLSNNALPLYLCRPISKAEYVIGKMAVLFIPLSLITWVPGLLLWSIEAGLNTSGWGADNLHLIGGVFVGSWLWILLVSLLGLALSAWVKWRIMASALLFGVFFISAAFSAIVNEVLDTKLGYLLNLGHLIGTLWAQILQVGPKATVLGEVFDIRTTDEIPRWAAWAMVAAIFAVCIKVLDRKLRGREVVS
jgi:ABC-2 type transport system permease protein